MSEARNKKPIRAVIDTNVLISALCFGGLPAKIIRLALTAKIELSTSAFLIDEFRDVMKLKFPHREAAIVETLNELALLWDVVSTEAQPALSVIGDDPDDDRVLECAAAAKAACIVSGDRHLLDLGRYQDIPILSPRDFLKRFG